MYKHLTEEDIQNLIIIVIQEWLGLDLFETLGGYDIDSEEKDFIEIIEEILSKYKIPENPAILKSKTVRELAKNIFITLQEQFDNKFPNFNPDKLSLEEYKTKIRNLEQFKNLSEEEFNKKAEGLYQEKNK